MSVFSPTDGRVCATATVTVTLEVVVSPAWDTHDLKTIYSQSARQAVRDVKEACGKFATVRDVKVRAVLTDDRETEVET